MGCSESSDKKAGEVVVESPQRSAADRGSSRPPSAIAAPSESNYGGGRSRPRSQRSRTSYGEPTPRPPVPEWLQADNSSFPSSSSSVPQLFKMSKKKNHASKDEAGTWEWWMEEVRRERITRDGISREHLQDLPNRLQCLHHEDPKNVEIDFSQCYMERSAPYSIGTLLASPHVKELQWVTSLRLDGNYFTDHGFGSLLSTLSTSNERHPVLPNLEQLYLNNMNLDRGLVAAIFSVLFPVDEAKSFGSPAEDNRIGNNVAPRPNLHDHLVLSKLSKRALFPSLHILSLSDNYGLGDAGLVQILRSMIAAHYRPHALSVLDLSRCGVDASALRFVHEFLDGLPKALQDGLHPVVPHRLLLLGNEISNDPGERSHSGGRSAVIGLRDPDVRVEL